MQYGVLNEEKTVLCINNSIFNNVKLLLLDRGRLCMQSKVLIITLSRRDKYFFKFEKFFQSFRIFPYEFPQFRSSRGIYFHFLSLVGFSISRDNHVTGSMTHTLSLQIPTGWSGGNLNCLGISR